MIPAKPRTPVPINHINPKAMMQGPDPHEFRRRTQELVEQLLTHLQDSTPGALLAADTRIRELERQLGRKTLEVEILKEALDKSRSKKPTLRVRSLKPDGSQ